MTWVGEYFTAEDDTKFVVTSEHVRGERRFYYALERAPGADASSLNPGWKSVTAFDGSTDKRVVKRRIERYAKEHHGA